MFVEARHQSLVFLAAIIVRLDIGILPTVDKL
jgi:hypothetical protein